MNNFVNNPSAMSLSALFSGHQFAPAILRQYDIRGTIDQDLSAKDAYVLGVVFAQLTLERTQFAPEQTKIAVGQDGRLSSPMLSEALINGIVDVGVSVLALPTGPTPMLYFADKYYNTQAAIMVTGSHNPANMNGFKMVMQHGPFYGDDIATIGLRGAVTLPMSNTRKGRVEPCDCREIYIQSLLEEKDYWPDDFAPNVVWDAGNGAAGEIMQSLCKRLPGHHTALYADIDGHFPNHHPDPTVPKNLVDLHQRMTRQDADFGFAFDGDGDRIGVMLPDGSIMWGDRLMMLLSEDVLRDNPGAKVIADVKSSDALFDYIARKGGMPEIWNTGHALIKSRMKETSALLAGEMSGHLFFADRNAGYDDALYAAMRLMTAIARRQQSLSAIAAEFPVSTITPEVRVACPEERKAQIIERTRLRLQKQKIKFLGIDGMRVTTPDGWWLLRASNTEPILVLRAEAKDKKTLDRLWAQVMEYIVDAGLQPVDYNSID